MSRELSRSGEKEISIIDINRDAFIRTIVIKTYFLIKTYLIIGE
jgi:hypothetical protein